MRLKSHGGIKRCAAFYKLATLRGITQKGHRELAKIVGCTYGTARVWACDPQFKLLEKIAQEKHERLILDSTLVEDIITTFKEVLCSNFGETM